MPLANAFRLGVRADARAADRAHPPAAHPGGRPRRRQPGRRRQRHRAARADRRAGHATSSSAVLDHGPSIGVRGELTRDYLVGLGFRDVEVIGCPSLFLDGDRLTIRHAVCAPERRRPGWRSTSRRTSSPDGADRAAPRRALSGPDLHPAGHRHARAAAVGRPRRRRRAGRSAPDPSRPPAVPRGQGPVLPRPAAVVRVPGRPRLRVRVAHPRHIAALIAGTPAVVLAHDSRTLELARYFDIPHRLLRDVDPATLDAADLLAEADFGPLVTGHAARYAPVRRLPRSARLDHVFRSPAPMPDPALRLGGGDLVRRRSRSARGSGRGASTAG